MRKLILLFLLCYPIIINAQKKVDSVITSIGWVIKPGDTLTYGIGSNFNKTYLTITYKTLIRFGEKAPAQIAGNKAVVTRVEFDKLTASYYVMSKDINGTLKNQWFVSIDKAIKLGEVEIPDQYKIKESHTNKADEIKKLYDLKQVGAISEEEYEREKAKLLNQ